MKTTKAMTMTKQLAVAITLGCSISLAGAVETAPAKDAPAAAPKVKYQAGKDVNFEEMLIQGQFRRPEISVVTGNVQQGADGLLRLRDNFTDRIQMDAGEDL